MVGIPFQSLLHYEDEQLLQVKRLLELVSLGGCRACHLFEI